MTISAKNIDFKELNQQIKASKCDVEIVDCIGQRFMASAISDKTVTITGTPGNALGAYLDGGTVIVNGNAQDAVGDTMNDGKIIIHGNAGDALGYAMRGGSIFVKGNASYRTGIHMKEYKDKKPVIVIGGTVGSFLGEYLAGGIIIVLGIGPDGNPVDSVPVGNFTGTGMHGGRIYIRTDKEIADLPEQVTEALATSEELSDIEPYIKEFCGYFGFDAKSLIKDRFYILEPNAKNPYKQLYTEN